MKAEKRFTIRMSSDNRQSGAPHSMQRFLHQGQCQGHGQGQGHGQSGTVPIFNNDTMHTKNALRIKNHAWLLLFEFLSNDEFKFAKSVGYWIDLDAMHALC